ncbi:MAG TPA: hypothetical protein VIV58_21960 [Kofleriaceae bacterium]
MPVISAHVVRKPRKEHWCATCHGTIGREPHVVAFGNAERRDPPYRIRICLGCAASSKSDTTVFLRAMKFIGEERLAGRPNVW